MKSVGIVTLFGLYNFGNRLQNYAVQEIFREYGFEVMTIVSSEREFKNELKFWGKSAKNGMLIRALKFHRFNKRYIPIYTVQNHPVIFPKSLGDKFTYYAVGSDQVWNPNIRKNQRDNFFLKFADPEKRIAIAPSIAVDVIPDEWRECYIDGLNGFKKISVRESNSVELINGLVEKDVSVLADPTIVIPIEKWERMEKKVDKVNSPYMLVMFLGSLSSERKKAMYDYAEYYGLSIVNLSEKKWVGIAPDEFLYLVHHSEVVITDSFHCTVFSILFNRPFAVYERSSTIRNDVNVITGKRIDSLLAMFSDNAEIQADNCPITPNRLSAQSVKKVIDREKRKYELFLSDQFA